MIRFLDSASALNAPADVKAGYSVHARYLAGSFALTSAEVKAATEADEGIWSIWELAANAALRGAEGGKEDAVLAVAAAKAIKQPKGSLIWFTCDFDPLASQLSTVFAYFNVAIAYSRGQGYKAGVYGGASVVAGMRGKCDGRWQAAGWSYGVIEPGCLIYQQLKEVTVGGTTCDVDYDPNASQPLYAWNGNGLYPPVPKPVKKPVHVVTPIRNAIGRMFLRAA